MQTHIRFAFMAAAVVFLLGSLPEGAAQTRGEPESFTAVAIANDNLSTGVGRVEITVSRWSTEAERTKLVNTLLQTGPKALLAELQKIRSVGRIRTPDSIGYDLRYSQQTPTEEGGRRIVLGTDRPIGFWELTNQPRTIDYPFTVVQMELDRNGHGQGTVSYFTKVLGHDNIIELENYSSQPVLLTQIEARRRGR